MLAQCPTCNSPSLQPYQLSILDDRLFWPGASSLIELSSAGLGLNASGDPSGDPTARIVVRCCCQNCKGNVEVFLKMEAGGIESGIGAWVWD